jgi:competence protein ComEA
VVALEGRVIRERALDSAITAYTAAHGHPLDHPAAEPTLRRWATRARVVVAAALVLAATTGIVVARAFGQLPSVVIESGADGAGSVVGTGPSEAAAAGQDVEQSPVQGAAAAGSGTVAAGPGTEQQVIVHVVGQVNDPGLVHLDSGARVAEAIEAAGGSTAEADLAALNLARVLTDGEQVRVPRPGEQVPAAADAGAGVAGPGEGGAAVDLNAADVGALDALPGIGPVLAQRIVDWRTEHGRFTTVDELGEVTGIGPAVLADLRELVRV